MAVSVGFIEGKGRALFAKQNFVKDQVIFVERPIVAMQTLENKAHVLVCANCFAFVGNVEVALNLLLEKITRTELWSGGYEFINFSKGSEDFFGEIVFCRQGCGEVYCSEKCCLEHYNRGHKMLCVGLIPEELALFHPLMQYKSHAVETNEIFLMAADVIANVLCNLEETQGNIGLAIQDFKDMTRPIWWHCAGAPDDVDPQQFRQQLIDLVQQASALLRAALFPQLQQQYQNNQGLLQFIESLFTVEYFARMIGMFEQNNVGIRLQSPVHEFVHNHFLDRSCNGFERFLPLVTEAIKVAKYNIEHRTKEDSDTDDSHEMEEENEVGEENEMVEANDEKADMSFDECVAAVNNLPEDDLFLPLDGTSIYRTISCMNHSCVPNCFVRYRGGAALPLEAEIVALQDIPVGEELVQSYIDSSLPFQQRTSSLRDYNFICKCQKCLQESSATP